MNGRKLVIILMFVIISFSMASVSKIIAPPTTYGNVAVGKFYKFSENTSSSYSDEYPCLDYSDGAKLTDEAIGLSWPLSDWVGWHNRGVDIVLDLGSSYDIDVVRLNTCSRTGWSIYFPPSLSVSVRQDDSDPWQSFGIVAVAPADTQNHTNYWFEITAEKTAARYVKFSMPTNANHLFVSEIEVYGDIKNTWKNVPDWGCYHGAFPVDTSGNLRVSSFEGFVEKKISMVLWYHHMGNSSFGSLANLSPLLELDTGGHRYLSVGWLPDITSDQLRQGTLDGYLQQWFTDSFDSTLRNHRSEPMWIRPINEMNSGWVSYGHDPLNFRRAWRRMYNIAEQLGVTEYDIFVWAPNHRSYPDEPWNNMDNYYPGDNYVDWVGISAYPPSAGIVPEEQRYPRGRLTEFYNLYADRKPLMIAEGGVSETVDQKKWVEEWFDCIKYEFPMIKAAIWENHNDRRIELYPEALEAYQRLVADPYFFDNIYAGNVDYNKDGIINLQDIVSMADAWQYSTADFYSYFDSYGLVVMEAEGFAKNIPGAAQAAGHSWQVLTDNPNAIGGAYVQALPITGLTVAENIELISPRLSYNVYFALPGTYYLWVRAAANSGDEMGYFGLNGNVLGEFTSRTFVNFVWKNNAAVFEVQEAGLHSFDIWLGNDGLKLDRILITQNPAYSTAAEPPVSQYVNAPIHKTDINADNITDFNDLKIIIDMWLE